MAKTFEEWWHSDTSMDYLQKCRQLLDEIQKDGFPPFELKEFLRVVWNEAQEAMKEETNTTSTN